MQKICAKKVKKVKSKYELSLEDENLQKVQKIQRGLSEPRASLTNT